MVVAVGGVLGIGARDVALPYGAFLWNYAAAPADLPRSSSTAAMPRRPGGRTPRAPGPAALAEVTGTVGDPARRRRPAARGSHDARDRRRRASVRAVPRLTREDLRAAPAFEGSR